MASGTWQTWWRRWDCRLARRAARWARALGGTRRRVCAITDGSQACGGSPLALTEYLHAQGIPVVWAYQSDRNQVPHWAKAVRAGTARHRWLAARSRWWVTDGLPMRVSGPNTVGRPLERGRDTRVLALVEPSVEKVGSDIVDWPMLTPRGQRQLLVRGETDVDVVAAPSSEVGRRSAHALGFSCRTEIASPLAEMVPARATVRTGLGIDADEMVVGVITTRVDSVKIAEALKDAPVRVLDDSTLPARDVIGACDVLVADTSGWAAVAARLGRPIVIFTSDIRDLLSRGPGLYLPWQEELPGPCVSGAPELLAALTRVMEATAIEPWAQGHAALARLAGDPDDDACQRLLRILQEES